MAPGTFYGFPPVVAGVRPSRLGDCCGYLTGETLRELVTALRGAYDAADR